MWTAYLGTGLVAEASLGGQETRIRVALQLTEQPRAQAEARFEACHGDVFAVVARARRVVVLRRQVRKRKQPERHKHGRLPLPFTEVVLLKFR